MAPFKFKETTVLHLLTLFTLFSFLFLVPAAAQDCSANKHCATGCCSKFGFCGIGSDFCGDGCLSTCDYVPPPKNCDEHKPCADGSCCSKFGFCGLGKKYCAPDVCVNNCTVKADCDPGDFGSDYVISPKCPLNVCCSKWGYCGVDEEHCQGQPKPKRPSCSPKDTPVRRVVGYYEGWAARRPCQQFYPENIPLGVYSHINFAFASIDPNTFAVVPADAADVELYRRLASMKKLDRQLKVYIAIGGWAFNDPGATRTTFSQLAESDANQKAFFRSLISFMETYDFDGVDIDWEYPAADDRGGKPSDFESWPKFVANLNAALKLSSSRGGLTVTLPVAYWYLRHFDIKKLEKHVDWFNMMSYDLHGAWDKENKWVGNYLNSHTNLTEITEYFDLMWRNEVDPAKVVMGIGFYSRTFKPSDAACTDACKKGQSDCCRFSTVGDRGECTREYGVLSNAEIVELEKATGATGLLDKDAAVKILKVNGEWITYDDLDSFKLKVDFAKGQCLGGVMVWAVSLDISDGTFSKQLQKATGYRSPAVTEGDDSGGGGGGGGHMVAGPDDARLRAQCFWTDCGRPCPADHVGIPRADTDGHGEIMLDSTACRDDGTVRTFCCPVPKAPGVNLPQCGWFDFNNGQCGKRSGSKCDREGWVEVGSYHGACSGYGRYQVACCSATEDVQSTSVYATCDWRGNSNWADDAAHCVNGRDYNACENNGLFTVNLVNNRGGTGAHQCWWWENSGPFRYRYLGDQSYCCLDQKIQNKVRRWDNCAFANVIRDNDGFCHSACAAGTVKVAMLDYANQLGYGETWTNGCKSGHHVYCCEGLYKTPTLPEEIADPFAEALQVVIDHQGECPYLSDNKKRDLEEATTDLVLRDSHTIAERDLIFVQACNVVADAMRKWLGVVGNGENVIKGYEKGWNDKVTKKFSKLTTDYMEKQASQYLQTLDKVESDYEARTFENSLSLQNDWATADSSITPLPGLCDIYLFYIINTYNDEDDGGEDGGPGVDYDYGEVDYSQGGQKAKAKRSGLLQPLHSSLDEVVDSNLDLAVTVERTSQEDQELDDLLATLFSPDHAHQDDGLYNLTFSSVQNTVEDDDDDEEEDDEHELFPRSLLQKRDGSARTFVSKKNTRNEVRMTSARYPNNNGGDQLLALNNDNHRYIVQVDTPNGWFCRPRWHKLNAQASKATTPTHWVTEHILELQTVPRFVDFLIDQVWPAVRNAPIPRKPTTSPIDISPQDIQRYMADARWNAWSSIDAEHAANSPLSLMLSRLGSFGTTDTMVVADADLNGVKAQLYRFVRPSGNTKFKSCCTSTSANSGRNALSYLGNTVGVFNYFADADVARRHKSAYDQAKKVLLDFEAAYKKETGRTLRTSLADLWKEYLTEHYSRVVQWATWWVADRTSLLLPIWNNRCLTATVPKDKQFGCDMTAVLRRYANHASLRPFFNPAGVFT